MNSHAARRAWLALALCMLAGVAMATDVNLNNLINETQQMSEAPDEMTLVWWVPTEFWEVSMVQDGTVPKEEIEDFVSVLKPYTVVFAVDGTMDNFGGISYVSEKKIRKSVNLVDSAGNRFAPLEKDDIEPGAVNLLSMLRPVIVNMLGPLGENMHFLVFPAKNEAGKEIAPATSEGRFAVELGSNTFNWRLPLGSLLDPKTCPKDGESMSGAWNFCPRHGSALAVATD